MAFENITSLAESFDRSLNKIAAKEKTSKKSLSKRLEKARSEHQKLSEEFKRVQKEHSGVQARFDDLKGKVSAKRKEIISLQNAGQKMDLADASDAIFHQDTNDVSYVIDGKEFHVDVDGEGNVNTVPWRDHRKAQKPVEPETFEGTEELTDEVSNAEDCADPPGEQDAANMDQAMLDDLYLKMTEEKTASYSDLIKKWGADHKEWTESSLLSGDWYGSLGDKVESFHEDDVPEELIEPNDSTYEEFYPEIKELSIEEWTAESDRNERAKKNLESEEPISWPELDESLADDGDEKSKKRKKKTKYSLEPREYDYDNDPEFNEEAMRELTASDNVLMQKQALTISEVQKSFLVEKYKKLDVNTLEREIKDAEKRIEDLIGVEYDEDGKIKKKIDFLDLKIKVINEILSEKESDVIPEWIEDERDLYNAIR